MKSGFRRFRARNRTGRLWLQAWYFEVQKLEGPLLQAGGEGVFLEAAGALNGGRQMTSLRVASSWSSFASVRKPFELQRRGDSGSPHVTGSIKASRSSFNLGF